MVQWLGLGAVTAGAWVQSLEWELRSCKLRSVAKKKKKIKSISLHDSLDIKGLGEEDIKDNTSVSRSGE